MSWKGNQSTVACVYFRKGMCNKGVSCTFLHTPASTSRQTTGNPVSFGPPRVCTFFARGACTRGQTCPYVHETPTPTPKVTRTPERVDDTTGETVCRFWARTGSCGRGNQCMFKHVASPLPERTSILPVSTPASPASPLSPKISPSDQGSWRRREPQAATDREPPVATVSSTL